MKDKKTQNSYEIIIGFDGPNRERRSTGVVKTEPPNFGRLGVGWPIWRDATTGKFGKDAEDANAIEIEYNILLVVTSVS
jgi:hypothetical protein